MSELQSTSLGSQAVEITQEIWTEAAKTEYYNSNSWLLRSLLREVNPQSLWVGHSMAEETWEGSGADRDGPCLDTGTSCLLDTENLLVFSRSECLVHFCHK